MSERERGVGTQAVHAGEAREQAAGAVAPPLILSSTFAFRDTAELRDFFEGRSTRAAEYGRYGNPTVGQLEEKCAAIEGAEDCAAFSSGMAAATTTILAFTKAGSHVVLFADCYRRTRQFVLKTLARFGVTATLVSTLEELEGAMRPETKLVVAEAPTNPFQRVVDLPQVAEIARAARAKLVVDSTFATPVFLRPIEHGADLVIHSGTKYLGGHNDLLAGVVMGREGHVSLVRELRSVLGAVLDPHAAYLMLRGLKSLPVRVRAQSQAARSLAATLEADARVERVWYPGLASHPDHEVASRLMSGFGAVITFDLKASLKQTSAFIDACQIPKIAPSLGGVESLIEQPALMSHYDLTEAQRAEIGVPGSLVRFAVGLEDEADLEADLMTALGALETTA